MFCQLCSMISIDATPMYKTLSLGYMASMNHWTKETFTSKATKYKYICNYISIRDSNKLVSTSGGVTGLYILSFLLIMVSAGILSEDTHTVAKAAHKPTAAVFKPKHNKYLKIYQTQQKHLFVSRQSNVLRKHQGGTRLQCLLWKWKQL